MADIKVQKAEDRGLQICQQVDEMLAGIQRRAYERFAVRGFVNGHDLEDWITAEREVCWPASELSERENHYVLSVALPGFAAEQVSLTATPHEVIVHATAKTQRREETDKKKKEGAKTLWSEFRSNDVYRRVELAQPIDLSKVSATLANGILKVVAEKATKAVACISVATAA